MKAPALVDASPGSPVRSSEIRSSSWQDPGISASVLRPLSGAIARVGFDVSAFTSALGAEVESWVPRSRVVHVLSGYAERLGEPSFGLTLARYVADDAFGTLEDTVWAGGNLRDALRRLSLLYALVTEGISQQLEERDGQALLVLHAPPGARVSRGGVLTDLALALVFLRAREATGDKLTLQSVRFRHHAKDPRPYEQLFGTEVLFGQERDELVFDAVLLRIPVRSPRRQPKQKPWSVVEVASSEGRDDFLDQVRAAVLRGVRAGDRRLARLARELGTNARTLQRRLRGCGTSHRQLVDAARRDLAMELLARSETGVEDAAYALGFPRVQAFVRAFSRWTGQSPDGFRAIHGAGNA